MGARVAERAVVAKRRTKRAMAERKDGCRQRNKLVASYFPLRMAVPFDRFDGLLEHGLIFRRRHPMRGCSGDVTCAALAAAMPRAILATPSHPFASSRSWVCPRRGRIHDAVRWGRR